MNRRWIVPALTTVLLFACKITGSGPPEEPEDHAARNARPHAQYPEWSLQAQQEAMERVAHVRSNERIEGLRSSTPPADWIALAYHGLVLDANYDVIELDLPNITKMQASMFSIVYARAHAQAQDAHGDLRGLFGKLELRHEERLILRSVVLRALLAVSEPELQERYAWRLDLLEAGANALIDREGFTLSPPLVDVLKDHHFDERWWTLRGGTGYVQQCRERSVPIPPSWPHPRWISQGPLAFTSIPTRKTTEIQSYRDPAVPGVCYAMARRAGAFVDHVGIICQSETTGAACFWDSRMPDGTPLAGRRVQLELEQLANGFTLAESCTSCHRGDDAFVIHPGSALDLRRASAVGGPWETSPRVRYTPLGRSTFENPAPLDLAPPPAGQLSCTTCHGLPSMADSFYCGSVLKPAALANQPPFGRPAGWPNTIMPVHPLFAAHVGQLASCE